MWINFNIWGAIIWKRNENKNRRRQLVAIKINLDCCYLPRTLLRNKRLRTTQPTMEWVDADVVIFQWYFGFHDKYSLSRPCEEFKWWVAFVAAEISFTHHCLYQSIFENAAQHQKSKFKIPQFSLPFLKRDYNIDLMQSAVKMPWKEIAMRTRLIMTHEWHSARVQVDTCCP